MGFWDNVGQGLKNLSEKSAEHQDEVNEYMDRYAYKSNDELIKEGKRGGSLAKKVAIRKLLRERGVIND